MPEIKQKQIAKIAQNHKGKCLKCKEMSRLAMQADTKVRGIQK